MIARVIRWSIAHRMAVLLAAVALALGGIWSVLTTPIDALPDLSDVQVILRTSYPGQAPQRVEDQVTYPLATTMMSVPGAKVVRAFSFFGDSFVYVIFDDGTDLYWARSRVLEALSQLQGRLPATAKTSLGPDATGLGWIFQYALVDKSGKQDLSQLRSLQDNFLKLELKSLPIEKTNLWVDVFERDLRDDFDPNLPKVYYPPGLLSFRGWGLERQLSGDHRRYIEALRADIGALRKAQTPKFAYVHGVQDAEKPVEIKVHLRGNPMRLGDEVPRRFLTVLNPGEASAFVKGSGRLELAETILKQPLTARVIVNRVFKSHFGAGIVDTPSNFGKTGDRPAHPELLDHLANYFLEQGGSFKKLHRYLMLSTAYRLSSKGSADALAKDPANRLYGRSTPHRMTAEQIRDSVLSVAGALDDKLYGPSDTLNPFSKRRTVYGKVSRYKLDEYLQLFDFPSPSQSAEKRFSTTVPLQRLFFMNSDFMQQYSETLSARTAAAVSTRDRIQSCYKFVFGRAATDDEIRAAETYLAAEPMRQYQERKVAAADPAVEKAAKEAATAAAATDGDEPESGGMMAGVTPGAKKADAAEKLLPVTVWGRYVKVLLSSTEFLFVN